MTIKRIFFLTILFIIFCGKGFSASSTYEYKLIDKVYVNDSVCILNKTSNANIYYIDLKSFNPTKEIFLSIDSSIINKENLTSFRYILKSGKQNKKWVNSPYYSFVLLGNEKINIKVEAKNSEKTFSETIIVDAKGYFARHKKLSLIIFAVILIVIYFWFKKILKKERLQAKQKINSQIRKLIEQKAEYEELLTNYLPKEEFEKLKKEKDKAVRYKMVTVLFASIQGFTKVAEQDDAKQLIDNLDKFFFEFDNVVDKLHIEKIKTIGDTYMCAGGIPKKNRTNPIEVVLAAFEMQQYMEYLKRENKSQHLEIWDIRMGIHTGPVFSSSTSKKRLEIWGETVNIASRMEASGQVGKVNITGMTYELVKDYFLCQYRGKMPVKYKGDIDMFFIEGFRPALSVGGIGLKANKTFITRLGHIRFDDLEEHVMNILEDKLPKNLYYHNLKHTIDVTVQVEIIGRREGVNDEDLLLLKTAALFHDSGFINTYKDHEEAGVELAKGILPDYDYTQKQIEQISEIIMATKMPPKPKNLLQQIICDADLDYLGRVDFIPVSGNLFKELKEHNMLEDDIDKWNQIQINFIENHSYFTKTAKKLRDVNKNNQLEAIRCLVKEK